MSSAKRCLATAAIATVAVGAFAGPAAAHKRQFEWVYAASTNSDTELKAQAALSTGKHPGTMKMILKKRVSGDWRFVKSKAAAYGDDGYYTALFQPVKGDKTCKIVAKHSAPDHPTIKKVSNTFNC